MISNGQRLRRIFGLGLVILLVRRNVPESPRWMFIHGKEDEAEDLVQDIESQVEESTDEPLGDVDEKITVRQRKSIGFGTIASTQSAGSTKRMTPRAYDAVQSATATAAASAVNTESRAGSELLNSGR